MNLLKIVSLFFVVFLYAEGDIKKDDTQKKVQIEQLQAQKLEYIEQLDKNIWHVKYNNYKTYNILNKEYIEIQSKIKKLSKKNSQTVKNELAKLQQISNTRFAELELLSEYNGSPFGTLMNNPELGDIPNVKNPFEDLDAFSYLKNIQTLNDGMKENYKQMLVAIDILEKYLITAKNLKDEELVKKIEKELKEFNNVNETFSTTMLVYEKKFLEINTNLTNQIKDQFTKILFIASIIVIFFVISFVVKLVAKKYITDNERFYLANKIINIVNFVLVILVLLFSYLENVSYLVTFLGFASAGIAIAMKDWFMSALGWFVMTIGGSIHVGDRIRVSYDGQEYVGDVLDISLLRITLQEDVTLTTYMVNRRAGRIIFVPNNYIFTHMIANYSHSGMKTVWDGIDINITFESNHNKALQIAKDIAKRYSKGYTDITRKQLNKLRDKYNLRNTNVEPRAFHFIEPYGMRVSVWFQTNSYATLTLKSNISSDIITAYLAEDDIELAYPTQTFYHKEANLKLSPEIPLEHGDVTK